VFNKPTVLIIGAGASAEVDLPIDAFLFVGGAVERYGKPRLVIAAAVRATDQDYVTVSHHSLIFTSSATMASPHAFGAEPVLIFCASRKMRPKSASVYLCVSAASRIRGNPVDPNSISSLVQTIFASFATFLLAHGSYPFSFRIVPTVPLSIGMIES